MIKTPYIAKIYLMIGVIVFASPFYMTRYYEDKTGDMLIELKVVGEIFEQSVIYMCNHSKISSYGLILNKKADKTNLPENHPFKNFTENIYWGGPVSKYDKSFVIRVNDNGSLECSEYSDIKMDNDLMYFSGYSGWMFMQLDKEFKRGDWGVYRDVVQKDLADAKSDGYWELRKLEYIDDLAVFDKNVY